ncbi:MAG: alpha/beta superfamily hydrolase [Labilithrix sp.]|nr:alpha/beta superfamily hydrolase [Labilithrix sp.]
MTEAVLLLHSGGMSSRQWRKLAGALTPRYRVISPDFIGSGDEPPWPADQELSWMQDVERIARLVDDLGEPVHVVGHSYGGLVAVTLARLHPERFRSVCAYDPVAFGILHPHAATGYPGDPLGLADLARVGEDPIFLDRERGGTDAWFEVFIDYWNAPGAWRSMPAPAREAFLRVGRKVFWEVYSLLHDRTPAVDYGVLEAPALFLTGERSPAAAQRVVALLTGALPDARSERVDGAGHMGPITHADLVNARIAAHLDAAR